MLRRILAAALLTLTILSVGLITGAGAASAASNSKDGCTVSTAGPWGAGRVSGYVRINGVGFAACSTNRSVSHFQTVMYRHVPNSFDQIVGQKHWSNFTAAGGQWYRHDVYASSAYCGYFHLQVSMKVSGWWTPLSVRTGSVYAC